MTKIALALFGLLGALPLQVESRVTVQGLLSQCRPIAEASISGDTENAGPDKFTLT